MEAIDGDRRKSWITDAILSEPKNYQTETSHLYSDLGYILLGFIVEQKSGLNLAQFFEEHIAKAVGVEDKLYFPPQSMREGRFVATRTLEGELLRGVVHDDNCRVMGGICGHAGLFGTSLGVLTLCQEIINVWMEKKSSLPFSSDLLKMATKRRKNSEWTAGFNLVSEQGSSSGSYFSDKSIGHLGFTGTSFWLDPVREVVVVLLTNRVIKGSDQEKIKQMRPEFHDFIQELLGIDNQLPS